MAYLKRYFKMDWSGLAIVGIICCSGWLVAQLHEEVTFANGADCVTSRSLHASQITLKCLELTFQNSAV